MNIEQIVLISVACPVFALFYCFFTPLLINFEAATQTHCRRAYNFFPSVSAAISYSPINSFLWFALISIHTPFRFKLAKQLYKTYKRLFQRLYASDEEYLLESSLNDSSSNLISLNNGSKKFKEFSRMKRWALIAYQVNKIELVGLFILSTYTSMSNFEMHKLGFLTFLIGSSIFTSIVCFIERKLSIENLPNCYHAKKKLAFLYACSFILAIIMYIWHNSACVSYVYSLFGLFELVLILSNVAFHAWSVFLIRSQRF